MKRLDRRYLFMGNGDRSIVRAFELVSSLMEAIDILGGIQQPFMSTDSPESEEYEKERAALGVRVEDIAEDIFIALTGRSPE